MSRRPLRIATTKQLERSVREAGCEAFLLPELSSLDFNRPLAQRLADAATYRPFLEKNDIELVLDFNTEALTLSPSPSTPDQVALTTATLVSVYRLTQAEARTGRTGAMQFGSRWQRIILAARTKSRPF